MSVVSLSVHDKAACPNLIYSSFDAISRGLRNNPLYVPRVPAQFVHQALQSPLPSHKFVSLTKVFIGAWPEHALEEMPRFLVELLAVDVRFPKRMLEVRSHQ